MGKRIRKGHVILDKHVSVKVKMPQSTYKALKIKTIQLDMSVQMGILALVDKWVIDVKRDFVNKKPNG